MSPSGKSANATFSNCIRRFIMDLNTNVIIEDLSISFDEIEIINNSTNYNNYNKTSDNDICLKALDYMLF